jgi:transposase-like protein
MTTPAARPSTPRQVAARLIAEAPDESWIRSLVDHLDRRVRTQPLERLLSLWGLSASEAARIFGVSRQALSKWRRQGPPPERAPAVAALAAATDLLDRHVKRERIPAVVRRPAARLGGRSLYEAACSGRHLEVRDAVAEMFDLRRVQP